MNTTNNTATYAASIARRRAATAKHLAQVPTPGTPGDKARRDAYQERAEALRWEADAAQGALLCDVAAVIASKRPALSIRARRVLPWMLNTQRLSEPADLGVQSGRRFELLQFLEGARRWRGSWKDATCAHLRHRLALLDAGKCFPDGKRP